MMQRLLLAATIGLFALACGGPAPAPAPAPMAAPAADHYTGHWRGLARISSDIPDAPQNMDITATITRGGVGGECGTIEYGSIGCSGVWRCVNSYDSPTMEIEETIRFGGGERCPPNSRIQLRATDDPNTLEFTYSGLRIQASGTLSRGDQGR